MIKLPRWACWLPAIFYMALIFYMSGRAAPEAAREMPIWYDVKLVHIIEYAVLSILIFFGYHKTTELPLFKKMLYSVLFTFLYGVSDEIHQAFVPDRSAKVIDAFTNLFAAVIGQGVVWAGLPLGPRLLRSLASLRSQ